LIRRLFNGSVLTEVVISLEERWERNKEFWRGNCGCYQDTIPQLASTDLENLGSYYNGFYQTVARQQLCKHDQTRNNRGMSSLLSSDSVNILVAANAGNNSEYITIIASNNTSEEVFSMQFVSNLHKGDS
jgi:hypothetical protein